MASHKLAALYLALLGLGFALFSYAFSNGATAPKLSWVGLSQARLGLYHRASGTKQIRSAAFADPNETLQGSTGQRLVESLRQRKVTLRQRTHCIRNTYARACNLPYGELSLGLAFGLSVLALSSAAVLWLGPPQAEILPGFILIVALFCAAGSIYLTRNRLPAGSLLGQLHALEVGLYRNIDVTPVNPDPNDPTRLEILSTQALYSRTYCRRLTFTVNCGVTVVEMPLSLPFLLGLGCLLSVFFIALASLIRLTTRRSQVRSLFLGGDEP